MVEKKFRKIKPAARLISTIGKDLIKDTYAAIIELVKNSYDADATRMNIEFQRIRNPNSSNYNLKLIITDNGHGMSFDTVLNKWMVPATSDKLDRKYSPNGRLMQGRKGIGRYATTILGEKLFLETVDNSSIKTFLEIDWREFSQKKYLEDVEILIESKYSDEFPGTKLTIIGTEKKLLEWTDAQIEALIKELRKILSPFAYHNKKDEFNITLKFDDFLSEKYSNEELEIHPFPILKLYDYRIYGNITNTGIADLTYENQANKEIYSEKIKKKISLKSGQKYCGSIQIDFRIFDRDPDSIDNLINKGLSHYETGKQFGKREVRKFLDDISGVSIERGGFRIRPYGDPGYDWLELDKSRVQNPSYNISSNQISGFVTIDSEERSNLEEKSARDGLKDNEYFDGLTYLIKEVLTIVQAKRYQFRETTGRGRNKESIENKVDKLFNFSKMTEDIEKVLSESQINKDDFDKVKEILIKNQQEKSKVFDVIQNTIAIYQTRATLGKIVMMVLHEGRKPLSWFRNQTNIITRRAERLQKKYDEKLLNKIVKTFLNAEEQAEILVRLFNKLEPLAIKNRGKRKDFNLKEVIQKSYEVFESELTNHNINVKIVCSDNISFKGWAEDFYVVFTNFIENSIYWLSQNSNRKKNIEITVFNEQQLIIEFRDNGPGIEEQYIKDKLIFDPGFTLKPDGSGIGLAIAGEAVERNNGELKALYSKDGVHFRIEFKNNDRGE